MKMTVAEAMKRMNDLTKLGGLVLPIGLSYAIARNTKKLEEEVTCAEKERLKLCERYAEKDGDGKPILAKNVIDGKEVETYRIPEEKQKAFREELENLQKTIIDVDIRRTKLEELKKCEDGQYASMSAGDVQALFFMIEE